MPARRRHRPQHRGGRLRGLPALRADQRRRGRRAPRAYRDLALGLGALYLALFVISVSVSRRLRHQLRENTFLAEHDPLTDLPNRVVVPQRAAAAVVRGRAQVTCRSPSPSSTSTGSRRSTTPSATTTATSCSPNLARRLADHTRPRRRRGPAGRRRVRPHPRRRGRRRGGTAAPARHHRARGRGERAPPVGRVEHRIRHRPR